MGYAAVFTEHRTHIVVPLFHRVVVGGNSRGCVFHRARLDDVSSTVTDDMEDLAGSVVFRLLLWVPAPRHTTVLCGSGTASIHAP